MRWAASWRIALLVAVTPTAVGCLSALGEAPELADIARPSTDERPTAELLADAQRAWQSRPAIQQVERASRLFLTAAGRAGDFTQTPASSRGDTSDAGNASDKDGASKTTTRQETDVADANNEMLRTALLGASRTGAWLADRVEDKQLRKQAAQQVLDAAQLCQQNSRSKDDGSDSSSVAEKKGNNEKDAKEQSISHDVECDYWLAIGLGFEARESPARSKSALSLMIKTLNSVAERNEQLEQGGPHRVLALVLVRAPGWPVGPRDPDLALEHAERAIDIDDGFPPNWLAIAEVFEELEDRQRALQGYEKAKQTASEHVNKGNPDAAEWLRDAEAAIERLTHV